MHTVIRETREPTELCIPGHLEPREYYIEQIFSPGKFNALTIFQALNVSSMILPSGIQQNLPRKTIFIVWVALL